MTRRKKKTDRCTGHCCERFFLPFSPEEIEAAYWAWFRGGDPVIRMANQKPMPQPQDIHLIAPMVIHLGKFDIYTSIPHVNPSDAELVGEPSELGHYYTCKHFDRKTRDCAIYSMRPQMCREYPYGKPCNYKACTWTSKKAKRETKRERTERLRVLQADVVDPNDAGGDRK